MRYQIGRWRQPHVLKTYSADQNGSVCPHGSRGSSVAGVEFEGWPRIDTYQHHRTPTQT